MDLGGGVRRTELIFSPLETPQLGTYQCLEIDTFTAYYARIEAPAGECTSLYVVRFTFDIAIKVTVVTVLSHVKVTLVILYILQLVQMHDCTSQPCVTDGAMCCYGRACETTRTTECAAYSAHVTHRLCSFICNEWYLKC